MHQQLGIGDYPLTPELRACLAKKGKNQQVVASPTHVLQPLPPPPSALPQSAAAAEFPDRRASLNREIAGCGLCALVARRQGQVMGAGTAAARLLIIGDYSQQTDGFSPNTLFGAAEDAMLWKMMGAIGLVPDEVYVTNAVKCCPQVAQPPEQESALRCLAYLRREIELIRPQIICAMGEVAAHAVLGVSEPVVRLRGRFHRYAYGGETDDRIQVMVTFHPRFLLEYGDMKPAAWKDLQMIQRQLQLR
jgi:DNA polymerase